MDFSISNHNSSGKDGLLFSGNLELADTTSHQVDTVSNGEKIIYLNLFLFAPSRMSELLKHCNDKEYKIEFRIINRLGDESIISRSAIEAVANLTPRELEILECLEEGLTYEQILEKLFIDIETVKTHAYNSFAKLEVPNKTMAIIALYKYISEMKEFFHLKKPGKATVPR